MYQHFHIYFLVPIFLPRLSNQFPSIVTEKLLHEDSGLSFRFETFRHNGTRRAINIFTLELTGIFYLLR